MSRYTAVGRACSSLLVVGAVLSSQGARADLVITEIHYAPVDGSGAQRPELEFVEIFNDGPEPYDLYGYRFTRGIYHEFQERTFLEPRSYLAVCRDAQAVQQAYGTMRAVGNFVGVLDNAGETVDLANPQGVPVSSVSYNDRNRWPAGAKGTGHSLSIIDPYSDPGDPDSWTLSDQMGGTPGAANFATGGSYVETALLPAGDTWRYFKGTQEPSSPTTAWRAVGFQDSAWLSGRTGIGYGDGDDVTVLSDMRNGYLTIFCRRTFQVADPAAVQTLVLTVTYDDGFYAYLNGTEVASRNVSGRARSAAATSSIEPTTEEIDLSVSKGLLQVGSNVLAVQVHNSSLDSSDLSFDAKLASRQPLAGGSGGSSAIVINEGHFRPGGGEARFVELFNRGSEPVDLAGLFLSDDFAALGKHVIAGPAVLLPGASRAFTESELGFDLAYVPGTRERISVALTTPERDRVLDAVIFRPTLDGRSEARVPDGDRALEPAADPTPGAPNGTSVEDSVVLNEIMYHPITLIEEDEYVEIHNRGDHAVELEGWSVDGVGFQFPAGSRIDPGAYMVIARDPTRIRSRYALDDAAIQPQPWSGRLRDSGERLSLLDELGNVVDTVRFHDGGEWPVWADGRGSSLERIDPDDVGDAAGNWDASDDSAKAVSKSFTYTNLRYGNGESDLGMMLPREGIVIVDDISLRSATGTELVSNGGFETGTSPWRLDGTHSRSGRTTDPAEVLTGSGSLKLISWAGGGDYKVNRVETDTGSQAGGRLSLTYTARWVVGSPRIIHMGDYNVGSPDNAGVAGSSLVPFPSCLGTPGEVNSVTARRIDATGTANVGPAIDRVSHSPPVPEGGQDVSVLARLRDSDGVGQVTLFYRTETPVGAFTPVTMSDPEGDGTYAATIPGQALRVRVLFHIEALDGAGATSRFPADILQRTHPPVLRPGTAGSEMQPHCMYRHDQRVVATSHHSIRFVLDDRNEDYMASRFQLSNEMLDGTLVFGSDKVYYNARIRFTGSPWLRTGLWSNSYSIELPKDDPLHGRKRSLHLDQHGNDGRERLSHYLLRWSAGGTRLPYNDFQALVRFQVNSVRDGTYESIAKPSREFLELWYPEERNGELFEMDDRFSFSDSGQKTSNAEGKVLYPPYGATSLGPDKESYRWFFVPRTNEDGDDFSGLQELCYIMDPRTTPNGIFDGSVWRLLDVEEVVRVWAVRLHTDDWDTWGGDRGKNCYFYRSMATGLWTLLPHDLELTYGNTGAFPMPASITGTIANHFTEVQRMLNRPRIKRLYYGILAEQVDPRSGFFEQTFLTPWVQQMSASGVGNLDGPASFIRQRSQSIASWVRGAIHPQVRLRITTNAGAPFEAVEPLVRLEGEAPADVFFLRVLRNGSFLDPGPEFTFSDSDWKGWTLPLVPLAPAVNTITVFGYGTAGDLVDEASIEITSTVTWPPPALDWLDPEAAAPGDPVTIGGSGFQKGVRATIGDGVAMQVVEFDERDPTRIAVLLPSDLPSGPTPVRVSNIDGQETRQAILTVLDPSATFARGDANGSGIVDVSDALRVLLHLFGGNSVSCADAADADDTGTVDITDALVILGYLFQDGRAPPPPFPREGTDPTRDDPLGCDE